MFKKILIGMGALSLAVVVLIAGVLGYGVFQSAKYDETAAPFVREAIAAISTWQPERARPYFSGTFFTAVEEAEFRQIMRTFSGLGELTAITALELETWHISTEGTTLRYGVNADYDAGSAVWTVTLELEEDAFAIRHFNLDTKPIGGAPEPVADRGA